jgi:sulfite reductase (ferredoxin)
MGILYALQPISISINFNQINMSSTSLIPSPQAAKDIADLEDKIAQFKFGLIPEDKFKHFRLTRGVYGQRQSGVQMIRIKLPYGKVTPNQLRKIAEASDTFSTGNLHLTTRQDIQLHFVKLEDSPKLWAVLEEEGVTLREACGNTVRNVTGSVTAGIDPKEPFDITPYVHEFAHYFLRNPICQDMGRKIKIAFSSGEDDTALTFMHDIGFIPRIKDGKRGFKVVIGGGLGAQAILAHTAFEFLPEDQYIPFAEAVIRVFDRHGERERRMKARLKFLVQSIGAEAFLSLVEKERTSLKSKSHELSYQPPVPVIRTIDSVKNVINIEDSEYKKWLETNVFEQKQSGYFGVYIRITNGDISSDKARKLADLVEKVADDDIRVTVNQGLLLRYVSTSSLPVIYEELKKIGIAKAGFDSLHDVTACPGSDTCNLAVTNSTELARQLEKLMDEHYPHLVYEKDIKIKISGCMNACGQHMIANIGFHGSSFKVGNLVVPAMQLVLGGGLSPDGVGFIAEKVIKIPTKRVPKAVQVIIADYDENKLEKELFNEYFIRKGKIYFYDQLKTLASKEDLEAHEYIDWGHSEQYVPEIGVGECAGISLDVVGTIINEAKEKLSWATEGLEERTWADSIYNSYSAMVIGAKALLLSDDVKCNTQAGIIKDFDTIFVKETRFELPLGFEELVYQINSNEPSETFAKQYLDSAAGFVSKVADFRQSQLDKPVVNNYYKA